MTKNTTQERKRRAFAGLKKAARPTASAPVDEAQVRALEEKLEAQGTGIASTTSVTSVTGIASTTGVTSTAVAKRGHARGAVKLSTAIDARVDDLLTTALDHEASDYARRRGFMRQFIEDAILGHLRSLGVEVREVEEQLEQSRAASRGRRR